MAEGGGTVDNVGAGDYGRDVAGIADMIGGKGDWGSYGGFNGINTGNKVMDAVIGSLFGGLGIIDRLAGVNIGNGIAGRGSSNDPVEGGANGPQDYIQQIIETLTGQSPQPRQPITANPRARGEGSRQLGSGGYRGINTPRRSRGSTLRRDQGPAFGSLIRIDDGPVMMRKPGWENPPPDLEKMPRIIDDKMLRIPAPTGSVNQMLGPNASTPPVDLSKMFNNILASTNQAVQDRSGGLNYLLGRGVDRGDFALDDNAATAVNPVLMQGRNQALQSLLNGSRVSDNIFDLSNLGANIGAKQGAQNIDVRSRIPTRARRF